MNEQCLAHVFQREILSGHINDSNQLKIAENGSKSSSTLTLENNIRIDFLLFDYFRTIILTHIVDDLIQVQ